LAFARLRLDQFRRFRRPVGAASFVIAGCKNLTIYEGGYAARHNHLAASFANIANRVSAADLCPLLLAGRTWAG
jgi:hypothetical protein